MGELAEGPPSLKPSIPPRKKIFKKIVFPKLKFFYLILRENHGIGIIIRIGQEIQCLPYAEFFL